MKWQLQAEWSPHFWNISRRSTMGENRFTNISTVIMEIYCIKKKIIIIICMLPLNYPQHKIVSPNLGWMLAL